MAWCGLMEVDMAKNKAPRTRSRDQEEDWFKARRKKNRARSKTARKSRAKNRSKK